jgi:hypothetical protein
MVKNEFELLKLVNPTRGLIALKKVNSIPSIRSGFLTSGTGTKVDNVYCLFNPPEKNFSTICAQSEAK